MAKGKRLDLSTIPIRVVQVDEPYNSNLLKIAVEQLATKDTNGEIQADPDQQTQIKQRDITRRSNNAY